MSDGSTQSKSIETQVDLRVVCVFVGALALFAPMIFVLDPGRDIVMIIAMTWMYERAQSYSWFRFMEYPYSLGPLPFTVWRVVFVYQVVRYYRGRGTQVGTILLGILAETLMFCVGYVGYAQLGWGWSPVVVPTPLMLVGALIFMWKTPFRQPKTPFDDQPEPDRWWRDKPDTEGFFMFRTRFLGGID